MRRKLLLLCALLCLAPLARAEDALGCPDGLEGPTCATCVADTNQTLADAACASLTESDTAWCYTNHTYDHGTRHKSYTCTTESTRFADVISDVWMQCFTDVQKCDTHFSLGGHALTCSALSCSFEDASVFCSYTKCQCDGHCPEVNGVTLGYMLDQLDFKTAITCEDSWPEALCIIDIQGLSQTAGGFEAYCKAGECRDG